MKKPSVLLAQAVHGGVNGPAAHALSQAITYTLRSGILNDAAVRYTGFLEQARNMLADYALANGSTHLFFVDADIVIPPTIVHQLLASDKDIISGLYFSRSAPYFPVAYSGFSSKGPEPILDYPRDKLFKSKYVGAGCLMIKCDVLRKLRKGYPDDPRLFAFENGQGEDVWFCNRAAEQGYDIWVDPRPMLGHVAEHVVSHEHFDRSMANPGDPFWHDQNGAVARIMGAVSHSDVAGHVSEQMKKCQPKA